MVNYLDDVEISLSKAEVDALTISWPAIKGAYCYTLEYQKFDTPRYAKHQWNSLSQDLKVTEIRKKNLVDGSGEGFTFRVGVIYSKGGAVKYWIKHPYPFKLKSPLPQIKLIDADDEALTVTWRKINGATHYHLEYRPSAGDFKWTTLSDSLATTQVRKKNLEDYTRQGFFFRVTAIIGGRRDDRTMTHEKAFKLLEEDVAESRMEAPTVRRDGEEGVALISWKNAQLTIHPTTQQEFKKYEIVPIRPDDPPTRYDLQMRENVGGKGWKTIASDLQQLQVRKKNLTLSQGYQFRIRPTGGVTPYSLASSVVVAVSTGKSSSSNNDVSGYLK